jgi:phosphoserine aminotransferase
LQSRAFSSRDKSPGNTGPSKRGISTGSKIPKRDISAAAQRVKRPDTFSQQTSPRPDRPDSDRVYNFSAGPAAGSFNVMRQVQKEWLNYQGTGMGFVEISHRDVNGPVQNCMVDAQARVKDLLKVPDTHHVLFMHGGAHQQFSAVPVNFTRDRTKTPSNASHGVYVDTGYWASRSTNVAHNWMKAYLSGEECPETMEDLYCSTERGYLKHESAWDLKENPDYVYMCMNETIAGLEYKWDPSLKSDRFSGGEAPPLVCDATSTLMSRPVDISKYGLIFASSGKNLGPAGICLAIVRDDLLNRTDPKFLEALPMLDYAQQANSKPIQNVYNTPPTFNIYMLNKVLAEYQALGGLEAMEQKAEALSGLCYDYIDSSHAFYEPEVSLLGNEGLPNDFIDAIEADDTADTSRVVNGIMNPRSRMNVCFRIGGRPEVIGEEARKHNMALEKKFTKQAAELCGIVQLMGHPVFGGLRITLYNQIEREPVLAALQFMEWFQRENAHNVAE